MSWTHRVSGLPELIHRAVVLAADPGIADVLRRRYRAIYVDEYQDTDPAQVQLLQALTSTDSTFVAVGDPDQSIYGFRGADVGGILRFRDDFPTTTGEPPQLWCCAKRADLVRTSLRQPGE